MKQLKSYIDAQGYGAACTGIVSKTVNGVMAIIPLAMLLVGSCQTAQLSNVYGSASMSEQFRIALFPDSAKITPVAYYPAGAYISRARDYVEGNPAALMLLTDREVGYIFGQPTLQHRDADASIWQYQTNACVVDLYFYDDDASNGSRVAHVDYRLKEEAVQNSVLTPTIQSDCLEEVDGGDNFLPEIRV